MAWYRVFKFQNTEASFRNVKLAMSSHFSNLGGLTCKRLDIMKNTYKQKRVRPVQQDQP